MTENKTDNVFSQIMRIVPLRIRNALSSAVRFDNDTIQEIVLRANRPVCIYKKGKVWFLCVNGCLTEYCENQELVTTSEKEVTDAFNIACGYSVYSHINEIKEGFVTINGGHRVGLSGTAVVADGEVVNIRDISTISLRVSREFQGSGEEITRELLKKSKGILLCGSPSSGKTTILRDVARLLSTKYSFRVSVVDSRGEIAAAYRGVNQKDVGMSDVLDCYPRGKGIEQAVRTLAPEYIICDEIGSQTDVDAIIGGVNSGALFIASMHAADKDEFLKRNNAISILKTGAFGKIAFLSGRDNPGKIVSLYDCEELINA